ncbi:MAG TPA: hypothetical protein PK887_11285 [Ignavibacteriales bacterium]|nr:hypothetical protein [Ignavibacteriales bacterium]
MKTKFIFIIIILLNIVTYPQNISNQITIYDNFAYVNDNLNNLFILPKGKHTVKYFNIPSNIDLNSVYLKTNAKILSQTVYNKPFNLISLLENADAKIIFNNGSLMDVKIIKLFDNQLIVENNNKIHILSDTRNYRIELNKNYDSMLFKKYIQWDILAENPIENAILNYKCYDISWNTNYIATINNDKINLKIFFSIENNTDNEYNNYNVNLVSGDVKTQNNKQGRVFYKSVEATSLQEDNSIEPENLDEYKIYKLKNTITLPPFTNKKIEYFTSNNIKYTKILNIQTYHNNQVNSIKPSIKYIIENKNNNNLGINLPKGIIKVYNDNNNQIEFIGEALINDISEDETLQFEIGKANDVKFSQKIITNQTISDKIYVTEAEFKINNYANKEQEVHITDNLFEKNEIIESSEKYEKISNSQVLYKIKIAPKSEKIIKLKVRFYNY